MKFRRRYFKIIDIDCITVVEISSTKKEVLSWLDEFLDNLQYDWFKTDDTFSILYKDDTWDYINQTDYDGHKIKRQNISSIVFSNDCTYIVAGNFDINEYGIVTPSLEEVIASDNIVEVDKDGNDINVKKL